MNDAATLANEIILLGAPSASVFIGEGDFDITSALDLSAPISVTGAGRDITHLHQRTLNARVAYLNNAAATISSLTAHGTNFTPSYNPAGAGFFLAAGMATNCVVTGCRGGGHGWGALCGAVYLGGPSLLVDSVVCSNRNDSLGGGSAVYVSAKGAVVDRCEIYGNQGTSKDWGVDGGAGVRIDAEGAIVRNCLIHHNESTYQPGAGVRAYFGTVENCTIVDNNIAAEMGAAGLCLDWNAVARNNIIWGNTYLSTNRADFGSASGATGISYSCAPELVFGEGNTTNAPAFRDAANCDYTLLVTSPTVGAGVNLDWMDSALDLSLNPRIRGRLVDMGCYEARLGGTLILVR